MKTLAILLMLLGVLLIAGLGLMSLLGFAMSFDAPGSAQNPLNWLISILVIVLPFIVLTGILIFSWMAFHSGDYTRSALIGSVFGVIIIGTGMFVGISSYNTLHGIHNITVTDAQNVRLYPIEKFFRRVDKGVDTIIIFPNHIVSYRFCPRGTYKATGSVGDLNMERNTITVNFDAGAKLNREELSQFIDEKGRKLTEAYSIR